MKLISLLFFVFFAASCQYIANSNKKNSDNSQIKNKQQQTFHSNNDLSCFDGAAQIVIYEKETDSLQYCDNGSWRPVPVQAFKKKITAQNLPKKTIREKIHKQYAVSDENIIVKADPKFNKKNQQSHKNYFCRSIKRNGKKSFRCQKKIMAH
jgi:hypothetical protein